VRAVVYAGPGQVRIDDVAIPAVQHPHGAVVKVALTGICGTDLHVIRGHMSGVEPGTVLGHEFVGTITDVGDAVHRLAVGDRVMSSDFTACGECEPCRRGQHWHCAERAFFGTGASFGPRLAGAQAEYVYVPHAETTLAKARCTDDAAILIGDNLATAWIAIQRARLQPGEIVAVIGGGAVGQLTALIAQVAAAGPVIVIEPNNERRAFAMTQGCVPAAPADAGEVTRALSNGAGADVVVDAVGGNALLDSALDLCRKGGRVVSVGVHASETWSMPVARCFNHELSLSFAIGDSMAVRDELVRMVNGGTFDPTIVIDRHVEFNDIPASYGSLTRQECMKVVARVSR